MRVYGDDLVFTAKPCCSRSAVALKDKGKKLMVEEVPELPRQGTDNSGALKVVQLPVPEAVCRDFYVGPRHMVIDVGSLVWDAWC